MPRTKTRGRPKSSKSVASEIKHAEALRLYAEGKTLELVAKKLGYKTPSAASYAVEAALQRVREEPAAKVRKLYRLRLTMLWERAWREGNLELCLKVLAREAKLFGLDAPTRVEAEIDLKLTREQKIEKVKELLDGLRPESP